MDDKTPPPALITALTTEHFVLQTAVSATTTEVGTRASLYIFSLSSALVALGFASRSREVFVPFVAIVLPAVVLVGVFTVIRLVDSNLEIMGFLRGIARIRGYYRTLSPEAAKVFAAERGRWPESQNTPALRLGAMVGYITTTASMVAFINSIVAGVGVALLAGDQLFEGRALPACLVGGAAALVLMALFLAYQQWRYRVAEAVH